MKINNFIEKVNQIVSCLIVSIMCLVLLLSINVKAEISSNIFTYNDYAVEYTVVNEWDGNQNIKIKFTNTGSEPTYNWALKFNAGGEIANTWNCTVFDNSGTNYIIKNSGYNYEINLE